MLAAQIEQDHQFSVVDMPDPPLPVGGALVRLTGCGFCGSDLDKVVNQKAKPGTVLGHEVVGIIETLDTGHDTTFSVGDRVVAAHHVPCGICHYCKSDSQSMCRHFKETNLNPGGFAQRTALSQEHLHHTTFKIPPDITDHQASCVEPLACVLRAIERAKPFSAGAFQDGSVVVTGLGFIGMLASQVYQRLGAKVYGLDVNPNRVAMANEQGFLTQAFDAREEFELLNVMLTHETELGKADIVFLSVVNQATINQALDLVRDGGTIILFTSPSRADVTLDPNALYFREINVIPSYSPSLAALKQAAEMIFFREIDVAPLMTHTVPLFDLAKGVELYQSGKAVKVFIQLEQ